MFIFVVNAEGEINVKGRISHHIPTDYAAAANDIQDFDSRSIDTIIKSGNYIYSVSDEKVSWRIVYRIDQDAIVILEVFSKKTGKTPKSIIDICRTRLREYDHG